MNENKQIFSGCAGVYVDCVGLYAFFVCVTVLACYNLLVNVALL